jgi:hypothetical protein
MKQFCLTVLATATANIISFLIYQGFVKSYAGKNIREEISRVINKLYPHKGGHNV